MKIIKYPHPMLRHKSSPVTKFDSRLQRIAGQTLEGLRTEFQVSEDYSRIFQHETDHLDGVLFIDRLAEKNQKRIEPILHRLQDRFVSQLPTAQEHAENIEEWTQLYGPPQPKEEACAIAFGH